MSEYKKFINKPIPVPAVQWTGENLFEVITFTDGKPDLSSDVAMERWEQYENLVKREGLKIFTFEGKMNADTGDWILRGVAGECYPCKPDIFKNTYDPV